MGAKELKGEEPLGHALETLGGVCSSPRNMKKGSLRWEASFFHLCLMKGPRSTHPGQGGHPYSFPVHLAPTVLLCGILAQNQSLDREAGRGRSGASRCCCPQSHVL